MNLNNHQDFSKLDTKNMLAEMNGLPEQLLTAWDEAQSLPLSDFSGVRQVIVAGMGGSAIGADLLKAYTAPISSVSLEVHRDYDLPAWANSPDTLVIVSSHSGNTEETISAMETALERGVFGFRVDPAEGWRDSGWEQSQREADRKQEKARSLEEKEQRELRKRIEEEKRLDDEVDGLLDKISREGITSLTRKEKSFLEKASRRKRGPK